MILRIYDGYNGHSGYNFSWTPLQLLPFCTNDDFHDFHHSHNCGNYGSQFRFLDTIFNTNKPFRDFKRKQRIATKE
jgi:sterol desaturase/sphingolipid hydroxylase (fatty acid hydroxylase superfamily)